MRMRRKKHLEEKLSVFTNLLETPPVTEDYRLAVQRKEYIDFDSVFGNENPMHLEIGCGKGQFACTLAAREPGVNLIAVEVNRNVLADACRKAEEMELKNLVFLRCGAEVLTKYLRPGSIDRLYLNFSCPYPKKAYENRRLTNERFMPVYRELLSPFAEIHQKTDNMHFFEYSIEQFSRGGFALKNVSLELHRSHFEGNIVTEYEEKFASMGMPIYRLEAFLPKPPAEGKT